MNEVQKELDAAFATLHVMSVSGDDVDRMVLVREHLRKAFRAAARLVEPPKDQPEPEPGEPAHGAKEGDVDNA